MRARLLLPLLLPLAALAQSAHWEPSGGSLAVGQVTPLQLVFEGAQPKDTPVPPAVDGLELEFSSSGSQISWVNGDYSHTDTYTYAALLSQHRAVTIPAFTVETAKGPVRVPAAHFDPAEATVGGSGQTLESAASSRLEAPARRLWEGEVFPLTYRIEAAQSYSPDFGHGVFSWDASPLVAEDWGAPEPYTTSAAGEVRTGFSYQTRAVARSPGTYRLKPINQLINLSVGVTGFGFFQQRQYQQFSVASNTPVLEVVPLPPAPRNFTGAVGDFRLASKVVPRRAAVGEPITWTLELSGTGNWPDIPGLPPREVSRDFRVVQPKPKRTSAAGKLFTGTLSEDVVLIATAPGTYTLEPFRFVYFDPNAGEYRTLMTPQEQIEITPGAGLPSATSAATGPGATAVGEGGGPVAPETPSGLPRDLLPGPAGSANPWSPEGLALAGASPFAGVLVLWFLFAWRKARAADPRRPLREARERLAAALGQLRSTAANDVGRTAAVLRVWQREAAALWGLTGAAPASGDFPSAAWTGLWSDVERTLYARDAALPSDWIARAETALRDKTVPAFSLREVFQVRHLLPFLLAAAAALALPAAARASVASSSYGRGDYAQAEAAWRADLRNNPGDWSARYNLSLALAQQDRWDEAAAQASIAFVRHPSDPLVRWQFALACDKAGFVPGPLAPFLSPGPGQDIARLASPAEWQRIGAGGAVLAALGLALLLAAGYGRLSRRVAAVGGAACLAAAILVVLTSLAGWRAYAEAADAQAAIVWRNGSLRSIPTEADTSQKTTALGAGSVGVVDHTFLGWVRLAFPNGQTGWVRREEIIPIWK